MQIESWGYPTFPVSAASGRGLEQLNSVLKDSVSVVAGPSGTPLVMTCSWSQLPIAPLGTNLFHVPVDSHRLQQIL